jgi:hypothetical protein
MIEPPTDRSETLRDCFSAEVFLRGSGHAHSVRAAIPSLRYRQRRNPQ